MLTYFRIYIYVYITLNCHIFCTHPLHIVVVSAVDVPRVATVLKIIKKQLKIWPLFIVFR